MGETSAAIAATEAKVASVLTVQPAMASNAAPPELGNAAGNVPTPSPYPTSARKPRDLSADIADTDKKMEGADKKIAVAIKKIAGADEKMEGARAKMESGRAKSAIAAAKMGGAGAKVAGARAASGRAGG
jgi:hypothetical protein